MLSSTVPRLAGATLVLVLGGILAALVGRGVTLLVGAVRFEDPLRRGAVALLRLLTLLVVLDLLGRLTPVPVAVAIVIVGWLAFRSDGRPVAGEPARWVEQLPDEATEAPSIPERDDQGRPARSAYDRRRLTRAGPDRRSADEQV